LTESVKSSAHQSNLHCIG